MPDIDRTAVFAWPRRAPTARTALAARRRRRFGCEIHPAWDGSGCYVLWAWVEQEGECEWTLLDHEDGAPLRFCTPQRARAYALKRGYGTDAVRMRWPPTAR
ncbi:hypothetical protein [Arhodomonas aquaeolei]|uniref:hypothetical protein n=1 Tax=Arhodomonas aquaeolei TaxID=2369 RepID=UPI0003823EBA|nr:hypothetical protein [Arhodomonas aquaeolei]